MAIGGRAVRDRCGAGHARGRLGARCRPAVWIAIVYSALFSLVVAYLIWYTAVQRVGSSRTSVYSNVTPIVAMVIAAVALGEPITIAKALGAAAVLGGVAVTRLEFSGPAAAPSES